MARRVCLVCLAWLIYAPTTILAQDGRLDQVRKDVRGPGERPRGSGGGAASEDDEDNPLTALFGALLEAIFTGQWERDDDGPSPHSQFVPYPYCRGFPGYRVPRAGEWPESLSAWDRQVEPTNWSGRLSLEDGNDFRGLNRTAGQFLLETCGGFGFLTSWHYFHERLSGGKSDELTLGDFNVIYSTSGLGSACTLRVGLGARTLVDQGRSDWGFNVHLGGDFLPARPVIISIQSDFGTVGSAGVAHGRATVGFIHRGWEVFGGYDVLRIGSSTLHGPLLGVRLWF